MAWPREQAGGLAEASRLLQEGLQLLAEREREVDRLLEDARERALQIREEAEQRARQITGDAEQRALQITEQAERRRAELEEQVIALRSEVDALRAEVAGLRSGDHTPDITRGESSDATTTTTQAPAAMGRETAVGGRCGGAPPDLGSFPRPSAGAQLEGNELESGVAPAAASEDVPHWGRRSTALSSQQAVRGTRASRRRWLPWLAVVVILVIVLVVAAVVATTASGGR